MSEIGADKGCVHCIWTLPVRKQPVLYLLYLEQSWIQSGYTVSAHPYLYISHLGAQRDGVSVGFSGVDHLSGEHHPDQAQVYRGLPYLRMASLI